MKQGRRKARPRKPPLWTTEELDDLIEEATVDAYGDSEQATGFFTMMEEDLTLPFETEVLGTVVVVEKIDITDHDDIVAICRKGTKRQRIRLVDLPLPNPPPPGAQWVAAYRHWLRWENS